MSLSEGRRSTSGRPQVLIVGGGVAALEALLALRAEAVDALDVTVVAPDERFVLGALTVAEPFSAGHADLGSFPAAVRAQGAGFHPARLAAVDGGARTVSCDDGEQLAYDFLLLAPGARRRAPYEHALTFGCGDPLALNGLLADLDQGYTTSVAFVVPGEVTWPLPLYELALMTAGQVFGMGGRAAITFLTPEAAPLGVFGPQGSAAVEQLLAQAGIELHAGRPVAVGRGRVSVVGGPDVDVQRVVTLPLLAGPDLPGVPADDDGFIPVDAHGRVVGMPGVYAMGDATANPIKQGGLACQQADAVVAHVAALVAARPEPEPLEPVLRGRLLTGGGDRFLERSFDQVHGSAAQDPLWWPPTKVAGRYLGPWLADQPGGGWAARAQEPPTGVDVAVVYDPLWRQADDVLGLEPLGRT